MLANLRNMVLAGLIGAGLLGLGGAAHAQPYEHVHKLSQNLEKQLKVLHQEVDAHFRPFPQYAHLHEHVTKMAKLTRHIHDVVDRKGSIQEVRAHLNELDQEFHHVQELVTQLAQTGQIDRLTLQHLQQTSAGVGTTLHHLRQDLGSPAAPTRPSPGQFPSQDPFHDHPPF